VLRDYGVVTLLSALIRGRKLPWGAISVHSMSKRAFDDADVEFLQSVANVLALAIERNEHEIAERREKDTLQTIFDNIPVMISFLDASGNVLRTNPQWERTLGWTAEETSRAGILTELSSDSLDRWQDSHATTRDGRILDTTWARFPLSDGTWIKFGIDVTERKLAEERFRQLAENIDESVWSMTADAEHVLYINPAGERLIGRTSESLREPRSWLNYVHPDDRERLWASLQQIRATGDFRIVRPDGSIRWADSRVSAIRDPSGTPLFVIGVTKDVTERKHAEHERARLLAATETALAKLHAIQSITEPALGRMSLDDLLGELLARLRDALQTDLVGVMLHDEQRGLIIRAVDGVAISRFGDGRVPYTSPVWSRLTKEVRPVILDNLSTVPTPDWAEWSAGVIGQRVQSAMGAPLVVEGKMIGAVAAYSFTHRKFTEEELDLLRVVADRVAPAIERGHLLETVRAGRERLESLSRRLLSVQEEERRRLAMELHDELGQLLTAVKINLESVPTQLREALESVDEAMQTTRDLALDLRPAMLDDLGLAAALRWYADRFAQQTHVEMHLAIEDVRGLDSALSTAIFRVAQEALTNIARHSAAKNVWLDLHRASNELELTVRDDGVGFDVDVARHRAAHGMSLGVLGMEERASFAGGSIEIHSTSGKGSVVRALFPIGDPQ
jgi:PAS domain S-box-containing protein